MSFACSYQWSAVRAFHYKALRALEMGLTKWGDSFEGFKQPFFIPTNLLPSMGLNSQDKVRKNNTTRPANTQQPSRHQIATTGPGTTTAAAKIVPNFMSASFANVLTTRPRTAPNASSVSPLAARIHHPSRADYPHRRPLPHQPSIRL